MFTAAQIVDGGAKCYYCTQDAVLLIANGADPTEQPVCAKHGLDFYEFGLRSARAIFGPKPEPVPA